MKFLAFSVAAVAIALSGWNSVALKEVEKKAVADRAELLLKLDSLEKDSLETGYRIREKEILRSGEIAQLQRITGEMQARERAQIRERCEKNIIEIAKNGAGTEQETWWKEKALFHGKQMEEIGAMPTSMSAEQYVDAAFKAAMEMKLSR